MLAPAAAPLPFVSGSSTSNLVASRAVYGGGGSSSNGSIGSSGGSGGSSSPRRLTVSSGSDSYGLGSPSGGRTTADAAGDGAGASAGGSNGGCSGSSIVLYENAEGQIVLDGVTEVVLKSAADLAGLLQRGGAARATASHK